MAQAHNTCMDIEPPNLTTSSIEKDSFSNRYLTPEKATESIDYLDGQNMNPFLFIKLCQDAYEKIDPLEVESLTTLIRSKISEEIKGLLSQTELNFDELMFELKRVFILKREQTLIIEELFSHEQKVYENPVRFGKRLLNILGYLEETIHKLKVFGETPYMDLKSVEKMAISDFIKKIRNSDELKMALEQYKPNSMRQAIELLQRIWNSNNAVYETYPYDLMLFENTNCLYCENRKLHCYDCPFQDKLDINTLNLRRIVLYKEYYENMPVQDDPDHFKFAPDFFHQIMESSDETYNKLKRLPIFQDNRFYTLFDKNRKRLKKVSPNILSTLPQVKPPNKLCKLCEVLQMRNSRMTMRSETPEYCSRCFYKHNNNVMSPLNNRELYHTNNTYTEKETSQLCAQIVNLYIEKYLK